MRDRIFGWSYPPGVTGNEPEIVGEDPVEPTPGPWTATPNGAAFNIGREGQNHHMIAVGMTSQPDGEHEANVRLIATAPELLEALEEILAVFRGVEAGGTDKQFALDHIWMLATKAVAKAEGNH
tara:strand:- start:5051 stop:5422 length:372 start_codon:yes stop_codon:yes gene_type:complete